MMRRWVGVAVIAGCLGLGQAARAQYGATPPGSAMLPEPVPFSSADAGPGQAPAGQAPGPLCPPAEPQGSCNDVSLPDDGTGAFSCRECAPECAPYFHIGAQLWRRQGLSSGGVLAVQDAGNTDTGNAPAANAAVLQKLSQINPTFGSGPRATFGYLFNNSQAVEVTAFYTFEQSAHVALQDPGRIDEFFFNPPLGFEGDNGMWLQADRSTTTLTSTLWGAEANYRYSDVAVTGAELIAGVRYLDLKERLTNFTDDDGVQFPMINGLPDPAREATYSVQTHNRLVAPQLGFEWDKTLLPRLSFGMMAKGAWGADFVDLQRKLVRGDGFVGFAGSRNEVQFSQTYELNFFLDFQLLERAKLRIGYDAMWFLNMANVVNQYDVNLQNVNNLNNRDGSIFFHGPMAEFQFLF